MSYDYKKGLKKLGKAIVYVLLAGLAAKYGNNNLYLGLAPFLIGLENYLKNR